MVRIEFAADASLAAIFAPTRLGIAMAAMTRIIDTTISSSIREKPFCLGIGFPRLDEMALYAPSVARTRRVSKLAGFSVGRGFERSGHPWASTSYAGEFALQS